MRLPTCTMGGSCLICGAVPTIGRVYYLRSTIFHQPPALFLRYQQAISDTVKATPVLGFASDGTFAMVDDRAGEVALPAQNNPYLIKVHCVTHKSSLGAENACASVELTIEMDYVVWEVRPALSWWLSRLDFSPNDLHVRHGSSSLAAGRVRSRPPVLEDHFFCRRKYCGVYSPSTNRSTSLG